MKTQEGLSVRQIEDVLLTISKNIGLVPVQNATAATPVSEDPTEATEGTDVSSDNADATAVDLWQQQKPLLQKISQNKLQKEQQKIL